MKPCDAGFKEVVAARLGHGFRLIRATKPDGVTDYEMEERLCAPFSIGKSGYWHFQ